MLAYTNHAGTADCQQAEACGPSCLDDAAAPAAACEDGPAGELRRLNAELAAAVEARDTFIAVAAHELRNPMTPIIGQIEVLLQGIRAGHCPLEQVELRLERVQHAMRRYLKRTGVLLDVSRITRGKLQFELEPCDLAALLRDVVDDHAEVARRTGIPITVTVPEGLSGTWDRLAVEQIVDNLLSNAIKYGARTSIDLSAELHGEQVRIQVRDHGGGVSLDQRARVFERFERAVGPGQRCSGFGVGLWVVRQLAEALGGTVAIEDAMGGGALFAVTLPQHTTEAHLSDTDRTGIGRVPTATNGKKGLDLLAREQPQLVISDLMMPVMDDAAMLEAMAADPTLRGIPVVMISSWVVRQLAEALGGTVAIEDAPGGAPCSP